MDKAQVYQRYYPGLPGPWLASSTQLLQDYPQAGLGPLLQIQLMEYCFSPAAT